MTDAIVAYLVKLGTGGLFVAVFIEAMGIPFPGGLMLVFTGFLVSQHSLHFLAAFLTSVAGFTAGASLAFYLGRTIGEPVFERYGKYLHITPEKFHRAQHWMNKSSAVLVMFGRFIPMVSNITPYMAGISGLGWFRFLIYNSVFVTIWSLLYILLGMFVGRNWKQFASTGQYKLAIVAGIIIAAYLLLKYTIYYRRNKVSNV